MRDKVLLRWTQAALFCVILLVFVGAIVRATGSGLGCPDWPKCWACLIPPFSVDQVDFDKINIEKFKKKAERAGRNPDEITRETLKDEFNPMHTWIEFINRLFALPLTMTTIGAFIASFLVKRRNLLARWMTGLAVLNVFFNAWLGAKVVFSGLKPGIITLHMALAFLLILFFLIVIAQLKSRESGSVKNYSKWAVSSCLGMFICLFLEGLLGSQLREVTDELAKSHYGEDRGSWIAELAQHWQFYVHRSFSWSILIFGIVFLWAIKKSHQPTKLELGILAMILSLMVMGIILGHIGILPIIQILHVGFTSLLFSALAYWLFARYFEKRGTHSLIAGKF